jgi:predicted nucleic acid-binding protein
MRLHRESLFSKEEALELLNLFHTECRIYVRFLPVTQSILNESLRLVIDYSLKPADALQLATALEAQSSHTDTKDKFYFVVDDAFLSQKAQNEGVTILKPRDANSIGPLASLL